MARVVPEETSTRTQEISVDSDVCVGDPEKADRVVRDIVNYRLDKRSRQVLHEDGFVHVQPTSLTTNWAHSSPTVCAAVAVCYPRTMRVPLTAMSMAALILAPPTSVRRSLSQLVSGHEADLTTCPLMHPRRAFPPAPASSGPYNIRINTECETVSGGTMTGPGRTPGARAGGHCVVQGAGCAVKRITPILHWQPGVTANTSLQLARSPQVWLNCNRPMSPRRAEIAMDAGSPRA